MNVTLDSRGYAQVDNTYNDSNYNSFVNQIRAILAIMNTLDRQQIADATNEVIKQYAGATENFTEFLNDWQAVLSKVNNNITL